MLCNGQKKRDIEKIDFSYCNKYKIPKCAIWKMKKIDFSYCNKYKIPKCAIWTITCIM